MAITLSPDTLSGTHPLVNPGSAVHSAPIAAAVGKDSSGNAAYVNIDSSGNVKVAVTGAGSGGTSSVDETPFVAGTSAGTPMMAYDPTSGELLIPEVAPGTRTLAVSGSFSSTPPTSNTASVPAQKTVGTTAGSILASNGSRKGCAVQNTGTTVIKLGLGTSPTATAYHIALPAGGVADDGSSNRWDGTISGVLWQGSVSAISSAAGGTCVVSELT